MAPASTFPLFTANPANRIGLVRMANWFNQNRGIVTVCQLVEGNLGIEEFDIQSMVDEMDATLSEDGLVAFSEVDIVPEFESSFENTLVIRIVGNEGAKEYTITADTKLENSKECHFLNLDGEGQDYCVSKAHVTALKTALP